MTITINYQAPVDAIAPTTPVEPVQTAAPTDSERTRLDALLLPYAPQLIQQWCGETQISGNEITMRNPLRHDKSLGSFKFNTQTGAWGDFAVPGCAGHGLAMLYAALTGVPLTQAIAALQALVPSVSNLPLSATTAPKPVKPKVEAVNPADVQLPPDVHPELGPPDKTYEYLNADNEVSFIVNRFEQPGGKKETRPLAYSPEKGEWRWQYPEPPFPVYHLPDLLARPTAIVVITEGEKATDAAASQFPDVVVITSACGSEQALRTDWSPLKGHNIIIAPDNDAPGRHYALSVTGAALTQGAASVKVVDVWTLPGWASGDDLADHIVGADFLESAQDVTAFFEATVLEPHVVKAAALLGRGDFDRAKKTLADLLGIGVRTFEGLVKEVKGKDITSVEDAPKKTPFDDQVLEPWDEEVDGDSLFEKLLTLVHRYVILSKAQAVAVVVWIVFSYVFTLMRICPRLLVSSPSKRCGKSTLLEFIMGLARYPLAAANITPAAVFRAIEAWGPTLLLDEADTYLNRPGNEELTGIINSGHSRALAYVIRTREVDGDHIPVWFSTFCPIVIAMIRAPADTLIDRSIVITLVRKLSTQRVTAPGIDFTEQMQPVRRQILRWITDNLDAIKFDIEAAPAMGNDRARQNWAALAAVTQVMGPKAHAALLHAAGELSDTSEIEENIEVDLLSDIRDRVASVKGIYIQSEVLALDLGKLKERPWGEISHGKPMTGNKLAKMLKPFKIKPEKFRDGAVTHRGYSVAALQAVFDRYLPKPVETPTTSSTVTPTPLLQVEQPEQPEHVPTERSGEGLPPDTTGTCSSLPT